MTTDVVPILRVADAAVAAAWYGRLGYEQSFEHRFEPHLPAYVGIRRDGSQIHLSEHAGDALPHALIYIWVDQIDPIAAEFGVAVTDQPWAREIQLIDPDGNRLRVAQPAPEPDADTVFGDGVGDTLRALETAMWVTETRGDRVWMDAHLTSDFTEFGMSGRAYTREEILAAPVDGIDIELPLVDLHVRPLGRDAALVTYRSVQPGGTANRSSVWRRSAGRWLLAAHQGTPTTG